MNVTIDRRVLANFRRRAWRAYPYEHMEAILGHRNGGDVDITMFYHFPHVATVWECRYDRDEIDRIKDEAARLGLQYVGGIHTHTGLKSCEHASQTDHIEGVAEGSIVEAILYLTKAGRSRSRLNFYIPSEPIAVVQTGR